MAVEVYSSPWLIFTTQSVPHSFGTVPLTASPAMPLTQSPDLCRLRRPDQAVSLKKSPRSPVSLPSTPAYAWDTV